VFRSSRDGGGVYAMSALGGEERLVAKLGRDPRFSPDGQWIAYWIGEGGPETFAVYIVPAAGGSPKELRIGSNRHSAGNPVWSPDGKHLLVGANVNEGASSRFDPFPAFVQRASGLDPA